MASNIKTLKEDNGDIVYPQTLTGAVYTSSNTSLDTELAKYVTAEDIATSVASFGTVTTGMLADDAVTTAKIDDDAITTAKINNNAVTASKIDFSTLDFGNYSTTEVDTGFTWINGDKIYKRTYHGNTTNRDASYLLGFTPKLVIKVEGGIVDSTYGFQPWQRALLTQNEQTIYGVQIGDIKTSFHIQLGSSLSPTSEYIVTLYYTKNS